MIGDSPGDRKRGWECPHLAGNAVYSEMSECSEHQWRIHHKDADVIEIKSGIEIAYSL